MSLPRWLLLLGAIALLGWCMSRAPAVDPGPGAVAPHAPRQGPVTGEPAHRIGEFSITPLHAFAIEARVLGREDYRFGVEAELSPMDLALGWGRMSDGAVLERLAFRQGGRFFHYRWGGEGPPIPPAEIVRSSANMHMIPADEDVAAALDAVREGQVVRIEGWLVRADRADGWRWISSTTREDSGAGACELVLVARLTTLRG